MRGFLIAIVALLLFGGVAAIAYQAGAASVAGSGAAAAGYPYYWHPFFFPFFPFFGLLFPLLFFFLIFGLGRALFWGGYGRHWGDRSDRRRMLEEMHREMHERQASEGTEGR